MEQKTQDNDKTQQSNTRANTRKRYEPPTLVEYGNVANITQAMMMGSFPDAQQMVMMMQMM